MTRVRIPVEWEPDARAVVMPAAAKSALFTLTHESGLGPVESWHGDRNTLVGPSNPEFFVSPREIPSGKYFLSVQFFTAFGADGPVMATAFSPVRVLSDGTVTMPSGSPLERVAYSSRITELALLLQSERLFVNTQVQASVAAYSGPGYLGAIRPEAVQWSLVSGADRARSLGNGWFEGLSEGAFQAQATYQGLSSPIAQGFVDPPLRPANPVATQVIDAAYDRTRAGIWMAKGEYFGAANRLELISDATNPTLLDAIPLNGSPNCLAISNDGSYAFVGFRNGLKVARVHLPTKQIEEFAFGPQVDSSLLVAQIEPRPGAPTDAAVLFQQVSFPSQLALLTEGGFRATSMHPSGFAFAWNGYHEVFTYSLNRSTIDRLRADGHGLTSTTGNFGDQNTFVNGLGSSAGIGVLEGNVLFSMASGARMGNLKRVRGDFERRRRFCMLPNRPVAISIEHASLVSSDPYAFISVNEINGGTYLGGVAVNVTEDATAITRIRPLGESGVLLVSNTGRLRLIRDLPGL